jgi:cytosine/creatinine deaminase
MCSGAIVLFGVKKVVVGERETFVGEEELLKSRGVEIVDATDGVRDECRALMKAFIEKHPRIWDEDIAE